MGSSALTRLDRVAASAVLATLFSGVGALGWLLGHIVTYDATGHHHQHENHGYMRPLEQGGAVVALVGVLLAICAVALGRNAVARWIDGWRSSGSLIPWVAAAAIPAVTFVLVEALEGSIAERGAVLLAYGVPLQVCIGIAVLALVRSLLSVLVRVADRLAGNLRPDVVRPARRAVRPIVRIPSVRVAPMATNAALRAPPRRQP